MQRVYPHETQPSRSKSSWGADRFSGDLSGLTGLPTTTCDTWKSRATLRKSDQPSAHSTEPFLIPSSNVVALADRALHDPSSVLIAGLRIALRANVLFNIRKLRGTEVVRQTEDVRQEVVAIMRQATIRLSWVIVQFMSPLSIPR